MQGYPLSVLKYPLPLDFLKDKNGKVINGLYIAGGAVRDSILGIPPHDIDFYPTNPEALDKLLENLKVNGITFRKKNDILIEGDIVYTPFPKFLSERWIGEFDIILHCIENIGIDSIIDRFDFSFNKAFVLLSSNKVYVESMHDIVEKVSDLEFKASLHPGKHFVRAMKFIHEGYKLHGFTEWFEKFTSLIVRARTEIEAFALLLVLNNLTPKDVGIEYKPRIDISTVNVSYGDRTTVETVEQSDAIKMLTPIKEELIPSFKKRYELLSFESELCSFYDDIIFNRITIHEEAFKATQDVIAKYIQPKTTTTAPEIVSTEATNDQ